MKTLWLTLVCCCVVSCGEGSSSCKWHSTNQSFNWNRTEQSEYHLYCQLRTMQSLEWDTQVASLSRAYLERVVSLDVECSQVLLFESFLRNALFLQLPNLRELSVTSCKIREVNSTLLTSLSDLRSISIRTRNQEWPSMHLSLHQDSFSQFKTLQHLDLSDNAFGSVPSDLLCPLTSLRALNLSANLMDDTFVLQFNWNCAAQVEKLDLSMNRITRLLRGQVNRMTLLSVLQLDRNHVSFLAEDAFKGLKFLSFFNCSSNRINYLPAGLFQDCPELRQIDLSNNSVTSLSSRLFSGLVRLVVLNISRNSLTTIKNDTFTDLVSLQVLRLDHNMIDSVDNAVFAPLHNLHILDLSHNRLMTLNGPLFSGLFVLSSLSLAFNSIKLVERHSFQNCSGLRELDLSGNLLDSIPEAANDLQFLKSFDVSLNLIESLLNRLTGMNQLEYLNVAGNAISRLTEASFSNIGASSLGEINLASNEIETIERGAFNHCPSLKKLHLNNNKIVNINGLFHQLETLKWLNLSSNQISLFDYSFLPVGLEWLDLHQNRIEELGNYFQINYHWNLRYLDASLNLIENIGSFSIPDSVESLYLNGNRMQSIAPGTFLSKVNITRVDVSSNQLSTLEAAALWISPAATSKDRPEFSLGANPWLCDCRLDWLPQLVQPSGPGRQQPRLVQVADVTCSSVLSRQQQANTSGELAVSLFQVKADEFLCSYETHCFALCHCCDFYACDCQMTCPSQCTCYHDTTWTSNIVDCSGRQQVILPPGIPMDVTELYLDGNDLRQLPSHALIGRKNLRRLFLNSSNIVTLRNRTFHGLGSLQILHLEDNLIEEILGAELEPLENIRELYLQNNRLSFIGETAFIHLQWLQILRIDGNRLVSFPLWRLAANPHLEQLALSRNLWTCDCHFFGQLQVSKRIVTDLVDVRCQGSPTNLSHIVLDDNISQSCNELISTGRNNFFSQYLPLVTLVSLVVVMVVTLVVLAVSYRGFLLYWCQPHRCWVPSCNKKVITGSSHVADVFLVYSLHDEPFVQQYLSPELERAKLSYRAVCLQQHHQSYWNNSKPELFRGGLKNSQRTLLVVSASFLTIDWLRPDVRQYLLTLKKNLVVILLNRDTVCDSKFQQLLKTSYVLLWGEDKFWDKIHSVLPVLAGGSMMGYTSTTPRNTVKGVSRSSLGPSNFHQEISVDKSGNFCGHSERNHQRTTSQDCRYCVESNENSSSSCSDVEHTYVSVDHLYGTQERYSRPNENPFYRSTVAPVNDAGNITYLTALPNRPIVSHVNKPSADRVEIYNPSVPV